MKGCDMLWTVQQCDVLSTVQTVQQCGMPCQIENLLHVLPDSSCSEVHPSCRILYIDGDIGRQRLKLQNEEV